MIRVLNRIGHALQSKAVPAYMSQGTTTTHHGWGGVGGHKVTGWVSWWVARCIALVYMGRDLSVDVVRFQCWLLTS